MARAGTIRGIDKTIRKFGRYKTLQFVRTATLASLILLERDITDEPAELPGQKYIRTGTYHQGWNIPRLRVTKDRVVGRVATSVEYAPWVGSSTFQARIHRNRWPTDRGVMIKNRSQIIKNFRTALRVTISK